MSNFDIRWTGTAECTFEQERAAGITGRSARRGLLALFRFHFREPFEDERVRLVGKPGDQRQVIAAEAIAIVIIICLVHISPG
jgi:hypothetical protein